MSEFVLIIKIYLKMQQMQLQDSTENLEEEEKRLIEKRKKEKLNKNLILEIYMYLHPNE